jgi:hypothetical protein
MGTKCLGYLLCQGTKSAMLVFNSTSVHLPNLSLKRLTSFQVTTETNQSLLCFLWTNLSLRKWWQVCLIPFVMDLDFSFFFSVSYHSRSLVFTWHRHDLASWAWPPTSCITWNTPNRHVLTELKPRTFNFVKCESASFTIGDVASFPTMHRQPMPPPRVKHTWTTPNMRPRCHPS